MVSGRPETRLESCNSSSVNCFASFQVEIVLDAKILVTSAICSCSGHNSNDQRSRLVSLSSRTSPLVLDTHIMSLHRMDLDLSVTKILFDL